MPNIVKAPFAQWVKGRTRLSDDDDTDGDSDSSSSPLLTRQPSATPTQSGLPGSPRRNGIVIDTNIRTMYKMRAAPSPHGRGHLDKVQDPIHHTVQSVTSKQQELIPPSLSNSSLLSASSGASWQSVSSTSSKKHDLEPPFEVSPRAKRRLYVDTYNAAASSRCSAPCIQGYSDMDRSDKRRGGLLRRSGTPMQSFHPAPTNGTSLPPMPSYSAFELETVDSFPPPQRHGANITSAPIQPRQRGEQREVERSRHLSDWPLTSPPPRLAETAVPEPRTQQGDGPTHREHPIPRPKSDKRMVYASTSSRPGPSLTPGPAPQRAASADISDFKGAQRRGAFHTLEGVNPGERLLVQDSSGGEGHITMCGERPYGQWIGSWNGEPREMLGVGTLFPEGYQPRVGDSHPWICPVRDCQAFFPAIWALGGHFSAGHRACLLNDNMDGTMSVVGKRTTADPVSGRMPPIVVSRNPIDPTTAPPRAMPQPPGGKKKRKPQGSEETAREQEAAASAFNPRSSSLLPIDRDPRRPFAPASLAESGAPVKGRAGERGGTTGMFWRYLMNYLPHATPLPDSPLVVELLALARHRDLPHRWRFQLAGGHPTTETLCAVLVYLCGINNLVPCETCAGAGPLTLSFPECVTLPLTASAELKAYFGATSCCNRFYRATSSSEKQPYCISRFSLSSDLADGAHSVPEITVEKAAPPPQPDALDEDDHDDLTYNPDTSISTFASTSTLPSLEPTPSSTPNYSYNHSYKTAIPVLATGRPKLVSITKPPQTITTAISNIPSSKVHNPTTATTTTIPDFPKPPTTTTNTTAVKAEPKTKRHSSILRLAKKLGAKGPWREAVLYQPRESVLREAVEEGLEEWGHGGKEVKWMSERGGGVGRGSVAGSGARSSGDGKGDGKGVSKENEASSADGRSSSNGDGKGSTSGNRKDSSSGDGNGRVESGGEGEHQDGKRGAVTSETVEGSNNNRSSSSGGARRSRRLVDQQYRGEVGGRRSASGSGAEGSAGGSAAGRGSPHKGLRSRLKKGGGYSDRAGQNKSRTTAVETADWEVAPGRICVGTGVNTESIAFSSSYLAQGRSVPITEDAIFQVLQIPAAGAVPLAPTETGTRLCSVASGTVQVRLAEREAFTIGANGMWKVRPGAACAVMNTVHVGAVVHITTVGEDGI